MRYPVMNEDQLAARWNISTKTLRRWRAARVGPVYRKLRQLVRYFEEDVQEFERCSARHWMSLLGRDESQPIVLTPKDETNEEIDGAALFSYIDAKDAAAITGLPLHLFTDRKVRDRKRVPFLSLVGSVRYSLDEIYRWELANAVPGFGPNAPQPPTATTEQAPQQPERVQRWHELVREQPPERT